MKLNTTQIDRRTLLRGAAVGCGLVIAPTALACIHPPRLRSWMTIDGLGSAFSLSQEQAVDEKVLAAIRESGLTATNMTTPWPGDDFRTTVEKISQVQEIISDHRNEMLLVRSAGDLKIAQHEQRLGIIIGFQSTEMFNDSLDGIELFHGLGARVMQMTYNGPGLFGQGCLSDSTSGLSVTGTRALAIMNELGILVDASHANKATTSGTISESNRPIVISHTGCNAIYRHPRNNDDQELRALAERGGVAGIYLMPFLDGGSGELTSEMLMAHLDHALNICGEDHVGIGTDQGLVPVDDGPEYRLRLRNEVARRKAAGISAPGESADRPPFIPSLNHADRLIRVAELMLANGHSEHVTEKVVGLNFFRVMSEVW